LCDTFCTRLLLIVILESKKAHELFEEADRTVKDLQNQVYELKKSISKNFGPDNEFAALDGQCYELTNDEYIYKLCLFEKVIQSIYSRSRVHMNTFGPSVSIKRLFLIADWFLLIVGPRHFVSIS